MVEALLEWDLGHALPIVYGISRQPAAPSVRLYRYVRADVTHLATAPYNLSGIYTVEVIGSPEFAAWSRRRDELHDVVEGMVIEGIESGEFVAADAHMIRHAIGGILVRIITIHSGGRGTVDRLADEVTTFFLRGLLVDPRQLDDVRRKADAAVRSQ